MLVFSTSSLTPVTPTMVAEAAPLSELGLLPVAGAAVGCCWGCWGGTGRQQSVELAYVQEQAADLGQICSWAVTQPSIQLALVFAASF